MSKSMKNAVLFPETENGIYRYEFPVINGIKQYIQIRGKDKTNPILLFVHGGPGGSLAGLCHVLQSSWEEKFTVVNWDQRNTCKTFFANKDKASEIARTGTLDDYVRDIDEIIAYLHTVCKFDKLILMGFSWGSAIASEYAKRHSENLLCYIGVGQYTDFYEGFEKTCETVRKAALESKNESDLKKLEYFKSTIPSEPKMNAKFYKSYRIYNILGSKYISKHAKAFPVKELMKSPFLNFKEKKTFFKQDFRLFDETYKTMMTYNFGKNIRFEIPAFFVFGNEDYVCHASLFEKYFAEITSPEKKLVVLENAGHSCFYDQSERFLDAILSFFPE